MTFIAAIKELLKESLNNDFRDNYDYFRFGELVVPEQHSLNQRFAVHEIISRIAPGYYISSIVRKHQTLIDKFKYLYELLADKSSKELLIKILVYRILGHKKVKLPTNTSDFWNATADLANKADKKSSIRLDFMAWVLNIFDLAQIGWPIKVYSSPRSVYNTFVARQYEYHSQSHVIKVERGDIVIDAGGGWGDTTLRFAHQTGQSGRVYSFEIVSANRDIMHANITLNPELADRIDIVPDALWNESGLLVPVAVNGPASRINIDRIGIDVRTITVDDFAAAKKLSNVNFIKMDIEGAELEALKGAENTLRKYRPKLAISLYHKVEDFADIPKFIESLGLGYRYYLGHFTIHEEETVLFAMANTNQL
ncbi:MAG: FkbM family methyltransferase [Nitrospirae bacterium]|nr:FkbM family methyltransferase [Nitrospirota bacterium]